MTVAGGKSLIPGRTPISSPGPGRADEGRLIASLMRELRILAGAEAMLGAFQDPSDRWWLLRLVQLHARHATDIAGALVDQDPRQGYTLREGP